ncbi:hypothetical protein BaRGS_00024467 [Batillaria attramentaria]|uniref:Uncharacterized protein n=1 Tax=Batillaria attramentaria TaxID=370345 RepID=A0ABD0KB86_9CAEN
MLETGRNVSPSLSGICPLFLKNSIWSGVALFSSRVQSTGDVISLARTAAARCCPEAPPLSTDALFGLLLLLMLGDWHFAALWPFASATPPSTCYSLLHHLLVIWRKNPRLCRLGEC